MEQKNKNFAEAMQAVLDKRIVFREAWEGGKIAYYDAINGYVCKGNKHGKVNYFRDAFTIEDFLAKDWVFNE